MDIPPGISSEDLATFLHLFNQMDQETRDYWLRSGGHLLELVGGPSASNPYGKGKRKPSPVGAATSTKPKVKRPKVNKTKTSAPKRRSSTRLAG